MGMQQQPTKEASTSDQRRQQADGKNEVSFSEVRLADAVADPVPPNGVTKLVLSLEASSGGAGVLWGRLGVRQPLAGEYSCRLEHVSPMVRPCPR